MTGITVVNSEEWVVTTDLHRYWLKEGGSAWHEITRGEFIAAEREHRFYSKVEGQLATLGFTSGNTYGRITIDPISDDAYVDEPEFRAMIKGTRLPAVYEAKK